MKTVKFYNKTTGRWEPIAGISTTGGVSDYNDLSNKPDLSVYALKSELEALREELTNLINSQEPDSQYYTEYTIDNSVSMFSLRSVDNPINNGQYIPQFSDGYDYIKITLTNGNVTTNLNTSASEVEKIRIYYPAETTYIKFTDTKVKDVEYINGVNITDVTSMFQNCSSLQSANLSTLDSSKVSVDNTMFMGANTDAQLQFNDQWSYTNRDMGLIKMVEVYAYLYREDGLYDASLMYISSQYGELYNGLVFSHTDPTDERWRFEPLELEAGVTYSCYIGFEGIYGETFELNFSENAEIYFVGATPNSFTESRPEIGGNEEPEVEYITDFTFGEKDALRLIGEVGSTSDTLYIYPAEEGRPMNFELRFPDSDWHIVSSIIYYEPTPYIVFQLMAGSYSLDGSLIVRETYSGIEKVIPCYVSPQNRLSVHYRAMDNNYSGDYLELNMESDTLGHIDFSDCESDDYGRINSILVSPNTTYMPILYNDGMTGNAIHLDHLNNINSYTEIWISDDSTTVHYEKPNQPEEPSEPSQDYISGFDVDPTIDSFVFDKVDNRTLNLNIYPYEQGKQVSFSIFLEDSTLANSDTLYHSIDTYEYDNGYNNAIYCSVSLQIDDDLGTATLVIRESNSGIEKRISVSIVEPQPKITDFTISPESLTFSDDGNKIATVTVIPAETDRAVRFSYGISSTSQFNITLDESEAPNKYYVNIEATQLYKEEYEPVFAVSEERSGISREISVTIDSENVWVNPNANVKVYYNRADGNYDNASISVILDEYNTYGDGFWNSDDNGNFASVWIAKGASYLINVYDLVGDNTSIIASGTYTIEEDITLWLVEGENTFRTEKPEIGGGDEPEEPSLPYYVEYTVHAIDDYALNSGPHAPTFYFDGGIYSPRYEITLKDGTITDDTNTMSKDVDHVKAYYDNSVYKIEFNDKEIKDVLHIDIDTIEIDYLFKGCKKLESVNVSNWDVSGKTRSSEMFSECESLITLDLSGWDTSNFDNITRMFMGCKSLKSLNLSGWNTTKVDAATQLFQNCYALETLNISGWDTSNFSFHDMMFSGVPETVNFIYEGTNWTLTEEQTRFSGTFPWNQQ